MKYDIKIEFENSKLLSRLISETYFSNNDGKINGSDNHLAIKNDDSTSIYTSFKDLNGATVKVCNTELIDGSIRCLIKEENDLVKIYPISIYCIKDNNGKYIFY